MRPSDLEWERDGARHLPQFFEPANWRVLLNGLPSDDAGVRLFEHDQLAARLASEAQIQKIALDILGDKAKPVRAVYFNKTKANNWPLGWHQDRTIAVNRRFEIEGYSSWTIKSGVNHVEPPLEIMANMISLRLHFDDVGNDNAPLRFAPGSHKLGRLKTDEYRDCLMKCGESISLANAGDIWVYHTMILHASDTASKPRQRRVLQIDYSADELPLPLEWVGI